MPDTLVRGLAALRPDKGDAGELQVRAQLRREDLEEVSEVHHDFVWMSGSTTEELMSSNQNSIDDVRATVTESL